MSAAADGESSTRWRPGATSMCVAWAASPRRTSSGSAGQVHLREVAARPSGPRRSASGSGLPAQLEAGRRLVVAQPQPAGRPEERAGHAVLGVAEVVDVRRRQDLAEQRADRCELLGGRQRRGQVPRWAGGACRDLRGGVLRRPGATRLGAGLRDERVEVVGRTDDRAGRPRPDPAGHVGVGHDVDRLARGHPVGGQSRVRPPQVRAGACSTTTVPRSGPSSSRARSTSSWGLMRAPPAGC